MASMMNNIPNCLSSWNPTTVTAVLYRILRSIAFLVALIGTAVFCIDVMLGRYTTFAYPFLITATLCSLFYVPPLLKAHNYNTVKQEPKLHRHSQFVSFLRRFRIGDPNIKKIAMSVVLAPTLSFFIIKLIPQWKKINGSMPHTEDEHSHIANDFGKLSAMSMSFFLIPISNHSIILKCFGIDPTHAIRLHIVAGVLAIGGGLLHGMYWMWIWIFKRVDEHLWDIIIPPAQCWTWTNDNNMAILCNKLFVNLLGVIIGLCIISLGLTSLWPIRRNYYRIFYICHITFSILLLFLLTMHYYNNLMFTI